VLQDLIDSANTGKIKQFLESLQLLLTPVGTITVRPATDFVFQVNTKKDTLMKISFVSPNFKAWFPSWCLPSRIKIKTVLDGDPYRTPAEMGVTEATLCYHTLNRHSVDGPIIDQLGGEAKAKIARTEFTACMQKQANGEAGALLINGYWNIFYVRDDSGVLRVVGLRWGGGGWGVGADSVEDPREWHAGDQVFSR
jgi:hypothetical protein